jgi:predicted peptidase
MRKQAFVGACVVAAAMAVILTFRYYSFERPPVFTICAEEEASYPYLLCLPERYLVDDSHWPLLIFLHGSEEGGRNLELIKRHGPPQLIAEGRRFPFIVAAPQSPVDTWWSDQKIHKLVLRLKDRYRVDATRIYMTGISMGGFATWEYAGEHSGILASAIPVAGGGFVAAAEALTKVPIWAFHGADDTNVPVRKSQRMVDAVRKRGGTNVKLTIFPKTGHDCWPQVYRSNALYDWMLSHSR